MKKIYLCAISNIQSGTCNEDCKFCTQSVKYKANIKRYKQKDIQTIIQEAIKAKQNKAIGFCLVSAGKGLDDAKVELVSKIAYEINKLNLDLNLIACNGVATYEQLKELKQHGINSYNHNLETSRSFYKNICTTHTWDDRYQTCTNILKAELNLICGGIFGMGETQQDRIDMLKSISTLKPLTVPLNFFHPNEALPLQENNLTITEAFDIIKLAKDILTDTKRIMVAGGRELMFQDQQYDIFKYGANSIVIGDYLTTSGNKAQQDIKHIEQLGYTIASDCS
jgi:biotin synthase